MKQISAKHSSLKEWAFIIPQFLRVRNLGATQLGLCIWASQEFAAGIWNYFETYSCDYREALVPCRLLVGDFNWRERHTRGGKDSIRLKLSITSSRKKGIIISTAFCQSPEHSCRTKAWDAGRQWRAAQGGGGGAAPRAGVKGCCYQVFQCPIQAFRWMRSRFLLKKSVIPMDVNWVMVVD